MGAADRMKVLGTKFAKIDLENDDLDGKVFLVKGERGRSALKGGLKDKHGEKLVAHTLGARGGVDGQEAISHVTMGEVKAEQGWWWSLPKWKQRVWWRVKTLPEEYNLTIRNKKWRKEATKGQLLSEGIDYFFGKRIKLKYSFHPYALTFGFLELTQWDAIKLFYVFDKADKDGSGIMSQFEFLMYLDIERTEFNEKIFAIVDFDGSGEMDFREFVMCCWNYASATPIDLVNFSFFMYSTDGVFLKSDEVLIMLRHVFGETIEVNKQSRKMRDELLYMCEEYNGIDLSQFGDYVKKHMLLLEPCFQFQRLLRSKVIGHRFWKKQMKRRIVKFADMTWTDIYEDLKKVAEDEIRRAEEYRKNKKFRGLKNKIMMGFLKAPKAPPPKRKKSVKKKGPKFLTAKLKEKERYEVLAELYEDVDLEKLAERNSRVTEMTENQKEDGEFGHVETTYEIEHRVPGTATLDFMKLSEIEALSKEILGKHQAHHEKAMEQVRAEDASHKVRGLFDYENTKDGDGGIMAALKAQRSLRQSFQQPSKKETALSMFKKPEIADMMADVLAEAKAEAGA
jgi:hypothetical protein